MCLCAQATLSPLALNCLSVFQPHYHLLTFMYYSKPVFLHRPHSLNVHWDKYAAAHTHTHTAALFTYLCMRGILFQLIFLFFSFFAVLCAKNLAKKDFFRKYFFSLGHQTLFSLMCVTQLCCAQCCCV